MDVIVVLPNTTFETSGALNSMGPGGPNHFDNLLIILSLIQNTVFAEIFVVVLISDVTYITFKKLNNWRCRGQHAKLARFFRN